MGKEPISFSDFLCLKEPTGDVVVDLHGVEVSLTNLSRVYFRTEKITKYEVLRYYARIWPYMKPYLAGRPAILQRYPRGIDAPRFFQHDLPDAPPFVRTQPVQSEGGRVIEYAVYDDLPGLLYLVNLGNIEQHAWFSTVEQMDCPDYLVIDLDPGMAAFEDVLSVALLTKEVLASRGLTGFAKTSGSSGMHIYAPLLPVHSYRRVLEVAREVAEEIVERAPDLSTLERTVVRRGSQIYLDYQVNARGKSLAAPFTVRARPGATVSMPCSWEEVAKGVRIADFTLRNAQDHVARHAAAWDAFWGSRAAL